MDTETVIGCAIIASAMAIVISLVLWSRASIHRIARKGYRSAREILKDNQSGP